MKPGRIGKIVISWFLCLVMVITTVNLPMFTTIVQADGIGTINITNVVSDFNDVNLGDYGGVTIYFEPVEGAKHYSATLYEQLESEEFMPRNQFTVFNVDETTGNQVLYCNEAYFKENGYGANDPLFKFVIRAYDSHENVIAEGTQQIKRLMSILDKPIVRLEPSGVAHIKFGTYTDRANLMLDEKKDDGSSRQIAELLIDITDLDDMKVDFSEVEGVDEGYEYQVRVRAISDEHFYRCSEIGYSEFAKMTGVPVVMTTLAQQDIEIDKTTQISVEAKKAEAYEWVISQGTTDIDMSEIKKHATVVGEKSEMISITPHDDFLNGKSIECQVSNSNGTSTTNKALIELSGSVSSITFSNVEIKTGMTVGDFKQKVSIDNPYLKMTSIEVRDSSTEKIMSDTDVFESVGHNKSGYMVDYILKANSTANFIFDLNDKSINYNALNAIISDVSVAGDTVEIKVDYEGQVLEDKKISAYPLHIGDTLSTDITRFKVEGDQSYSIKEINWGVYNGDNGKMLTASDTNIILKVTLAPNGLNELIWEKYGVKGYLFADSVLKMKMGDVLLTGELYGTDAATQYTKDETVTYFFTINDIKNSECVYNVNALTANGNDIVSKRNTVAEAVSLDMETEGSISYEASLDKSADYGDRTPVEGELIYESKYCKLYENNTYDSIYPDLVLNKNAISIKDISSLENGEYFVIVTAKNKKYDMEASIWGAYRLAVSHGTHSYADEWKYNATNHWKECSCGDKKDVASHELIWITDQEPTDDEVGLKHQECSVCGYKNYVPFGMIKSIELTVAEPEVGGAPDMKPQLSEDASKCVTIDYISWTQNKPSVSVLDEYSTFKKGNKYLLRIHLKPSGECKYDSNTVVKLNGQILNTKKQNNSGELLITVIYYPGLTRVNDLHFDVKYPKPGETEADTAVVLDEAEFAIVKNCTWRTFNGNSVSEFQNGKEYVLAIGFSMPDGYYIDENNTNIYANRAQMEYDYALGGYYSYNINFICENHNLTLVSAKDATCAENGNKAYYICSDCDDWFEDADANYLITDKSKYIIPATGKHDFSAQPYHATDDKTQHYQECKECGAKSTPVAHGDTEVKNAKTATCTEKGYTGDKCCKDCGAVVEAGKDIAATGHTWDEGKVTKEPTKEATGEKTYTCTKCGETKVEVIDKLPDDIKPSPSPSPDPDKPTPDPTPAPSPEPVKPLVPEISVKGKFDVAAAVATISDKKPVAYAITTGNKKAGKISKTGIFTAKKSGEVEITAYADKKKTDEITKIKLVIKDTKVPVKDTISYMDDTCDLRSKITNLPLGVDVKFSISEKQQKVATVDAKTGIVTPVKDGKAKVTIEIGEGKNAAKFYTTITVKTAKFSSTKPVVIKAGNSKPLALKNVKSDDKIVWSVSDGTKAEIVPGTKDSKIKVKGIAAGKVTLTADVNGHKITKEIEITE